MARKLITNMTSKTKHTYNQEKHKNLNNTIQNWLPYTKKKQKTESIKSSEAWHL